MARKVTVGLASHWPRVTDIVVLHLQAQGLGEGDEHSSMLSCGARFLPLPGKLYCTVARDKIVTK